MTEQQSFTIHSAMAALESYLFFGNSGDLDEQEVIDLINDLGAIAAQECERV